MARSEERSLGRAVRRILLLTSSFPRWDGDSTTPFVLHLAQDLQALGIQVDVLAPHAPGAARREGLGGLHVERFRYLWPHSQETVCYGGGALINLRDRRSNAAKVPFLVGAEMAATLDRLKSRRYDLLNAHWALPQGFVGAVAGRILKVPHVLTVHGGDVFALGGRVMSRFKRFALEQADAVTVNSSVTRRQVLTIAPGVREVRVIPMGISDRSPPATDVDFIRKKYRHRGGPLLVFAGRLVEEKGLEDLLLAMVQLLPRFPHATAIIAGEGQHRATLEALAARLGIAERVFFVGWVQPAEIQAYLAAGDVVVAPSRRSPQGWVEAQGLVVIEAMNVGVPVVASGSGGLTDAVLDGETGLLVSERAPQEIHMAVERICTDPELRARLKRNGQQMAAGYGRSATASSFAALFADVASRAGSRRDRPEPATHSEIRYPP
ncbi:MAG TPA: glycosyltransferase [Actinomycetota bacterium]